MRDYLVLLPSPGPDDRPETLGDVVPGAGSRTDLLRGSKLWFVLRPEGSDQPARLAGTAVAPAEAEGESLAAVWLEQPIDLRRAPWVGTLLADPDRPDGPVLVRSSAHQQDLEDALATAVPVGSGPPPESPEGFGSDLLPPGLVAEYLAGLEAAASVLDAALERRQSAPAEADEAIRRLAHQLRGSGSSYGFPEITRLATAVGLATSDSLPPATRQLADLLRQLESSQRHPEVLLVEDDPAIARLLASHLSRAGLGVQTAATAGEGIQLAGTGRFDLVVLDLVLADDDGRHVLARLRDEPATRTLPVFVMSARLSPGVRAECLQLGAEALFEKPLDGGAVAGAVVERLRRRAGPPQMPGAAEPAAATAATQAPGPAAPATRQARILLAEDDDMVASIVKHRLRKAGHLVEHVTDGTEAVRWVEQPAADLVILDIKMPGMDGLQVLRHLRAQPQWRAIPVIILTALGNEEDLERGFDLGADDYLTKPFSPTELAVRVERLLRRG